MSIINIADNMTLGYACINTTLRETDNVRTSRGMIKRTFEEKGLGYVSELALQNAKDLIKILRWNEKHNIRFFRLGSELFPFMAWYELEDLPDFDEIALHLKRAGDYAIQHGHRITQHPDHFIKLASKKEHLVEESIATLEQQARTFDLMGFDPSVYNKLNIHIGGVYGDKVATAERFCNTYEKLSVGVRNRLTIENDDRANSYSVQDLYELVYKKIGIPIVFDYHHHTFNTGGLSEKEALELAISTWPSNIIPVVHYSEPRPEYDASSTNPRAHSDLVHNQIQDYGNTVDIMLEAKHKEKALLNYRENVITSTIVL